MGLSNDSNSLSGFAVEVLENDELVRLVETLRKEIRILKLENEVLEKSIIRLDPALMNGVYQALDFATKWQQHGGDFTTNSLGSFVKTPTQSKFGLIESMLSGPSRMFASQSRLFRRVDSSGKICGSVMSGGGPRININERLELLAITIECTKNDLEKCKRNAARKHAYLKAQLEETQLRTVDIEASTVDFNKVVVKDSWDPITLRIPAEAWLKFMADWQKATDKQIGRLRLRTSTLNIQYRKYKEEAETKRDLSQNLTPVDFDKIKIENEECMKILENKNLQLDELKTMTGDANLNLTIHKKIMQFMNTYLGKVEKLKARREQQTVQLEKETNLIQIQAKILKQKLKEIRKMRMAYHIPNTSDYVDVKEKTAELNYAIKRLETKLHIKKTAAHAASQQLRVLYSKKSFDSSIEENLTDEKDGKSSKTAKFDESSEL
ncbi:coiled-coil domain-containing protein 113-like [Helicoverpa armigera]|uniref:coiled-coil domain-containing protein 113-like n=1 Tax=Helicoverpa armigera TaxID=29058 RepID=UPI003083C412